MSTTKTVFETMNISGEKVISLISELLGKQGYPGLDHPQPSGYWDPYIRNALERIRISGLRPELWQFRILPACILKFGT